MDGNEACSSDQNTLVERSGPAIVGERDTSHRSSRWLRGHVPGEPGIWFFVLGDMVVFAVFFGVFLVARSKDIELFARSRAELNTTIGMTNTVVLLTSSLLVAWTVAALRRGDHARARCLVLGAIACGVAFLVIKVVEYSSKISVGITPMTNDFFMYYFVFTGIHAAHVLLGLTGLTVTSFVLRRSVGRPNDLRTTEICASFWHMVDLLWIVLFPLFYLTS